MQKNDVANMLSFGDDIPRAEQLALGIGNPFHLREEELERFFEIVFPLESGNGFKGNLKSMRFEAAVYLQRAEPQDFFRNALFMSKPHKQIDVKYTAFLQHAIKVYTKHTP
jgi:hypothetical protein